MTWVKSTTGPPVGSLSKPAPRTSEIRVTARPDPPPPEFVVRKADEGAQDFEEPDPGQEDQDTHESVAIGLDDDAADYSAAV